MAVKSVIIVHATSHAIKGEKKLKKNNISCRLVPVPRHISSDCGICLQIDTSKKGESEIILKRENIDIICIHDV